MKTFHYEDKRFKENNIDELNSYLKSMGFNRKLLTFIDSEITSIVRGENRADRVAISEYGEIVIVESEFSKPNDNAISKILIYSLEFYRNFNQIKKELEENMDIGIKLKKSIIPIMIVGISKNPEDIYLSLNDITPKIRIKKYIPYNINGEEQLNIIKNKLKNNEYIDLEKFPVLNYAIHTKYNKEPHEMLIEVSKIIEKIPMDLDKRRKYKRLHIEDCYRYVNKKHQEKVLEEIKMNDEFMEQIDQDLRDEGFKEGIEEGIEEGIVLKTKEAVDNVKQVLDEINASEEITQKVIDAINISERSK